MGVREVECGHKGAMPSHYIGWLEKSVLPCYNRAHSSSWLEQYTRQKTAKVAILHNLCCLLDCGQSQTVLADNIAPQQGASRQLDFDVQSLPSENTTPYMKSVEKGEQKEKQEEVEEKEQQDNSTFQSSDHPYFSESILGVGLGKPKAPEEQSSAGEGDDKVKSCEEPGDGVFLWW